MCVRVDYCCGFVQIHHKSSGFFYASYNKKCSTFALFEGRGSSFKSFRPYQSSPIYKLLRLHKQKIAQLWKWSLDVNIGGMCAFLRFSLNLQYFFLMFNDSFIIRGYNVLQATTPY